MIIKIDSAYFFKDDTSYDAVAECRDGIVVISPIGTDLPTTNLNVDDLISMLRLAETDIDSFQWAQLENFIPERFKGVKF